MSSIGINKRNVGRIAERIVSNELEYRGFRVSDLNKEGTAANADLLAARNGRTWQVQVKGATEDRGWWFGYGFCSDSIIKREEPMFNKHTKDSFYKAGIVVLLSVKSPVEYSSLVLPVEVAEKAAQMNLDRDYRIPRKDELPKKPGKVWIAPDFPLKTKNPEKQKLWEEERQLIAPYRNNWDVFDSVS